MFSCILYRKTVHENLNCSNPDKADNSAISTEFRERLRHAIQHSFYARPDGLFFTEMMDANIRG